jgi:hypothetical protein
MAFLALGFAACKKETALIPNSVSSTSTKISLKEVSQKYKIPLPKAGRVIERSNYPKTPLNIIPIFPNAFESAFSNGNQFVITPIFKEESMTINRTLGGYMRFNKDASNQIRSNLILFLADSATYKSPTKPIDSKNFTGLVLIINDENILVTAEKMANGHIIEAYESNFKVTLSSINSIMGINGGLDVRCDEEGADWPSAKGGATKPGWIRRTWNWLTSGGGRKKPHTGPGGDDSVSEGSSFGFSSFDGSSNFSWVYVDPSLYNPNNNNNSNNNNSIESYCNSLSAAGDDHLQGFLDGEIPLSNVGGFVSQERIDDLAFRNKLSDMMSSSGLRCEDIYELKDMPIFTESVYNFYISNNRSYESRDLIISVLEYIKDNPNSKESFDKNGHLFIEKYSRIGFSIDEFSKLAGNDILLKNVEEFLFETNEDIEAIAEIKGFLNKITESPGYGYWHEVSNTIRLFNPYIYEAFEGANNISTKSFHDHARGLSPDAKRNSIGAIGEGIVASKLAKESSIFSLVDQNNRLGGYQHDIMLRVPLIKPNPAGFVDLKIHYTDEEGNPRVYDKNIRYSGRFRLANISYEVKTFSENTSYEYLLEGFLTGVQQVADRTSVSGVEAGLLVFDKSAFDIIKYDPRVKSAIVRLESLTTNSGSQKGFLRLINDLKPETERAYYSLIDRIKNIKPW